jgi:hypothetical protein
MHLVAGRFLQLSGSCATNSVFSSELVFSGMISCCRGCSSGPLSFLSKESSKELLPGNVREFGWDDCFHWQAALACAGAVHRVLFRLRQRVDHHLTEGLECHRLADLSEWNITYDLKVVTGQAGGASGCCLSEGADRLSCSRWYQID